jgi:hypothetical protein
MWRLLPAAVLVELALGAYLLYSSVRNGITPSIPGAVVRILLMGSLGGLAVFRGARWARRLFAALLFFGGFVLLPASFGVPLPIIGTPFRGFSFTLPLFLFATTNLLVATAATVGGPANEARVRARARDTA